MRIVQSYVHPAGTWGDVVALADGRFAWFYSVPGAMVCEIDGVVVWTTAVPTDVLRFTRGAAVPDLACLGQGQDDDGYYVTAVNASGVGVAFGQNPVAIGPGGATYVVRSPDGYTRNGVPVAMPHTSQGIRDVLPDGTVVFGDATYSGIVGGHPFWQYQTRAGFTVGQAGRDVGVGVLWGSDYMAIPRPGEPLGVHGALSSDGRTLAVCAWTESGAELWLLEHGVTTPPIDKVPGPINTEPPKEPLVPNTPNRLDIVRAVDAQFPQLLQHNSIASCGEFTERVALQLHATDPGFGLLSKQPGEKQHHGHGIDSVIYQPTQQVLDIIGSAGARDDGDTTTRGTPGWSEVPKRPGNNWMAPIPVGSAPPLPGPVTPPPPAPPAANFPTLDHWLKVEFPQLAAAYKQTHGNNDPSYEWAAFQTFRRYQEPSVWTFEKMLAHERAQ